MNPFRAELGGAVLTVHFDKVRAGWEQWILLSSDRHHDNLKCNRELESAHLVKAKERGALIIDVGDLFCAMQGKWDPRSDMSTIREEDVGADYLDRIVMHAARDYAPFAENWLLLGKGNHETKMLDRHGVDLTSNLAHRLRGDYGARNLFVGGYGGWVRFMFHIHKTKQGSVRLKYYHGSGGTLSPVTRGVIQTNRQAVFLPDADVVVNGHNHEAYHVPIARERLSAAGVVKRDLVHFVRTATYKDDYGDGSGGWAVERGMPPKPMGCAWLRFVCHGKQLILMSVVLDVC